MKGDLFLFTIIYSVKIAGSYAGEKKFTDLNFNVIDNLKKYLKPQCIVFVDSQSDLGLVKGIKSLENSVYYTFLTSSVLEDILQSNRTQLNFFQRRTLIVTKEKLNLTYLINKVTHPFYVSWVIFEDFFAFTNLYLPISSSVIFIQSTSRIVSANQVYHLKEGLNETVNPLWDWDLATSAHPPSPVKVKKINFRKIAMNMLLLARLESCDNVHNETLLTKLECIHRYLLELMGQSLNFSINVVECQERKFPYTYPNGSDSELFLRLKHREVDFSAVTHIIRTHRKRDFIDFVWPTFILKSRMYLKQGRLVGRWLIYLKPLQSSVWWAILMWIIGTGTLIHVFEKVLDDSFKLDWSLALDLITSTFKALQVFCNQAISELPTYYSIRLILLLKLFVVLIFFQAYCGYLVSSLTIIVNQFPFKDLKGFFENQQYQIMTLNKGFHEYYFRKVIGEGQRRDFMLPLEELPETIQEAVDKLCAEDYLAFIEFREDFLTFDTLKCRMTELTSPVVHIYIGIAMPKRTPLKEFLTRELLRFKTSGLLQRLASQTATRSTTRSNFHDESPDEFKSVSITQTFSLFSLLGVGILLSIVILIFELIIQKDGALGLKFCKKYPFSSVP